MQLSISKNKQRGVSLLQLLVVLTIIGVLAGIAIPTYDAQVKKARRIDAKTSLSELANQQVEYLLNHSTYATTLSPLGFGNTSTDNFYALSLNTSGSTSFSIDATAIGSQASDTDCAVFRITNTGAKTANDSNNADNTANCW